MAKSTKALLTGRIQKCKTNPSIAHIGLATHGRSIQIGSKEFSGWCACIFGVLGGWVDLRERIRIRRRAGATRGRGSSPGQELVAAT